MKQLALLFSVIIISSFSTFSANFKSGDKVKLNEAKAGDYYIGAGEVSINTVIKGDLIIAGGEITVSDSVLEDLIIAGGQIEINGYVGDDIRVSGGDIVIANYVEGDIVVFGGMLEISDGAVINGDVVCFGGEVSIKGNVNGNLKIYAGSVSLESDVAGNAEIKAGEIDFNGIVNGDMEMSAESISLGSNAKCLGNIAYWCSDDEIDFSNVCDNAVFDEELAFEDKEVDWSALGTLFSIGIISYWVIFILSVFLITLLLEYFFGHLFAQSSNNMSNAFIKSFGYGMLYFIGIPVLILISFITIIGFPIGILALSVYGLSFIFATSIVGLTVAHYYKSKTGKEWTFWQTIVYALITVVILKIIFMIPILGTMLKTIAMAAVYGAFFMLFFEGIKKKSTAS